MNLEQDRVMIFIDGSNYYHGLRDNGCPTTIDLGKLSMRICHPRRHIRTYFYTVPLLQERDLQGYQAQQRFFEACDRIPRFQLVLGRLEQRGDIQVEKGVDIRLATDMITKAHQNQYDVAVLVSGDGDFIPVVEAVKDAGKHVEVAFFRIGRSRELLRYADNIRDIDPAFLSDCLLERHHPASG